LRIKFSMGCCSTRDKQHSIQGVSFTPIENQVFNGESNSDFGYLDYEKFIKEIGDKTVLKLNEVQ